MLDGIHPQINAVGIKQRFDIIFKKSGFENLNPKKPVEQYQT